MDEPEINDGELLNSLLEQAPYAVFLADERGRFIKVNRAACEQLGYTREELLSLGVMDIVGEKAKNAAREKLSTRKAVPGFLESWHRHKDGTEFPVELGVKPINYGGRPAMLGMARDIRDRKEAEDKLREARDLYQKILDTSLDAILLLDPDLKVRTANARTAHYLRIPDAGLIIDRTATDFVVPGDRPKIDEIRKKALEQGGSGGEFFTCLRPDGGTFPVEMSVSLFRDGDGKPDGFVVSVRDLSDRVLAEKALKESEDWMTGVLDHSPIYIFLSRGGRLEYVNKTALADAGVKAASAMLGRSVLDFVAPEYKKVMAERVKTLLETAAPVPPIEIDLLSPDGRPVPVSIYSAPFRYRGDDIIVTFALNIAAFKEASKAARASQEFYSTLTQAMPDFIYALDTGGRITYCNRWLPQFREDPTGKTQHEVFPKEAADKHLEVINKVLETGEPSTRVEEITYPDRKVFLENRLFPVRSGSGAIKSLIGITRDISDRKSVEENLRASEERYRQLFDNAADPVIINDCDGRLLAANRALLEAYGYSPEEAATLTLKDFDAPEHAADIPKRMAAVLGTGSARFTTSHLRKNGEKIDVDVRATLITWQGRPAVMGVWRDITERRKAEERLRASEEKYRALVETTDLGYLILDKDGKVLDANAEYVRQTGHSRLDEILGRPVTDWTADFNKRANAEAVALCTRQGYIRDLTVYYADKSGKTTPIEVNATVVGEGDSRRILSLCRDITERVKAQEELRRGEEKFSLVFHSSPSAQIISRVSDGRIVEVNDVFVKESGYSREELIGSTTIALRLWETDAARNSVVQDLKKNGTVRNRHTAFRRRSGETFPANYSAALFTLDNDLCVISSITDLSERRRAEAALMEVQRLESLGMIAGGLAHDFNNMLAGIMGNLSLLEMDLVDSKKKELLVYVAEALEGVNSCRGLMAQFSTFAKGTKPSRKRFSLCSVVPKAAALAMTGTNSVLNIKTPEALPDIDGDESQIFQTVNNIVLNATQAMPGGGTVAVELSEFDCREGCALPLAPGRYARIDIADNGIGMTSDVLARIFDPYFSTKGKGRGLGLAMAFSVARGHGGHIEAASEQGKGTRFSVYLPCLEAYSPCAQIRPTRPKLHKGSGLVLVLEDDESVTEMLTAMLKASGYTPVAAADGKTALRLFREKGGAGAFKAVIMDLVIPGGMGGQECLAELRKSDPLVAAVATSGYSDYPVMAGPEKYGFDSALPKPYSSEEFGNALSAALEKAAARSRDGAKIRKRSKK